MESLIAILMVMGLGAIVLLILIPLKTLVKIILWGIIGYFVIYFLYIVGSILLVAYFANQIQ